MPFWYVCLVEALTKVERRTFLNLFTKAAKSDDFHNRWDVKRKMINKPLTDTTRKLGLLNVVNGSEVREVGACSILKSPAVAIAVQNLQEMNADMTPYFDWGSDFGLSSMTASSGARELHIYPYSFDGGLGSGQPVAVKLAAGKTTFF